MKRPVKWLVVLAALVVLAVAGLTLFASRGDARLWLDSLNALGLDGGAPADPVRAP